MEITLIKNYDNKQSFFKLDEDAGDLKNAFGAQCLESNNYANYRNMIVGGSVTWDGLDGFTPSLMVIRQEGD